MEHGKKFNAAEKHFLKQKEKLDKELKLARAARDAAEATANKAVEEADTLRRENEQLRAQMDKLREAVNMSPEDFQAYLKTTADSASAIQLFTSLLTFSRGGAF